MRVAEHNMQPRWYVFLCLFMKLSCVQFKCLKSTSAPLCICVNLFVCVFVFMKLSCVQSEWLNTTCNHALYALTDVFSQEKHFHPFYFLMRPSSLTSSSGPSQLHAAWSAYMYVCTYRLFETVFLVSDIRIYTLHIYVQIYACIYKCDVYILYTIHIYVHM